MTNIICQQLYGDLFRIFCFGNPRLAYHRTRRYNLFIRIHHEPPPHRLHTSQQWSPINHECCVHRASVALQEGLQFVCEVFFSIDYQLGCFLFEGPRGQNFTSFACLWASKLIIVIFVGIVVIIIAVGSSLFFRIRYLGISDLRFGGLGFEIRILRFQPLVFLGFGFWD